MRVSRSRILRLAVGGMLAGTLLSNGFQAAAVTAAGDTSACIAALRADRAGALRLADLRLANYNATAEGSALATVDTKYIAALRESRDDYFKAHQYAFRGSKTTANSWVAKGNAAIARANVYLKSYNTYVDKLNAQVDAADASARKLQTQIATTDDVCAGL